MPQTNDRILVTASHSAFSGPWSKAAGAEFEREITKRRPSAGAAEATIAGRGSHGDLTITRDFEPVRDRNLARTIARGADFAGMSITVQDLDANDIPIAGSKTTYTGCAVKSCSVPDADATSSDVAEMTVVLAVGGVA